MAASPFRSQLEQPLEILRGLSPALVRQALPIVDQLLPLYMDVADGRQEFTPSPEETQRRIQGFYGILHCLSQDSALSLLSLEICCAPPTLYISGEDDGHCHPMLRVQLQSGEVLSRQLKTDGCSRIVFVEYDPE